MKLLLSMVISFVSVASFAGPEDHIQDQKCYALVATPGPYVSPHIPSEVCFESVTIDLVHNEVIIYSYFAPMMFADAKIISLIRNTEDTYKYRLRNILFADWKNVCSDGETVTLFISGQSDFNGIADMNQDFNVSVEQEATRDSCHSEPQTIVYNYKIR